MPWPKTSKYGIVDNPIVFNPYVESNDEGSEFPFVNEFLLLNGNPFGLFSGGLLLLL